MMNGEDKDKWAANGSDECGMMNDEWGRRIPVGRR
jgi:hypothetical protein